MKNISRSFCFKILISVKNRNVNRNIKGVETFYSETCTLAIKHAFGFTVIQVLFEKSSSFQ